jgi:hypothetical protein
MTAVKSGLAALLVAWPAGCAPAALAPAPGQIQVQSPARFILLGDAQKTMTLEFWRPHFDAERRAVIQAVAQERPAFVVNSGDVVCHGGHETDWRRFCEENRPLFELGIAYFPALGNHDYYGGEASALKNRATVFPHVGTRRWYPLRFDPILLLILDSNIDVLGAEASAEQDRWLEAQLRDAEADPQIRQVMVVCHHPPYTHAVGLSDSTEVQAHFVSRLTLKVRIFFSGHVHNYERFEEKGVHFIVSGGGAGRPGTSRPGPGVTATSTAGPAPARFTTAGSPWRGSGCAATSSCSGTTVNGAGSTGSSRRD